MEQQIIDSFRLPVINSLDLQNIGILCTCTTYTVVCRSIPEYIPPQLEVQNLTKEVPLLSGDEQAHSLFCKGGCILILCPRGFQMPIYTFGSSEGETIVKYSVIYIKNGGAGQPLYM